MPYHKILVGTDGSQTAAIAERAAADLASVLDAELIIVTAFDPSTTETGDAERILAAAAERAGEAGLAAKTELRTGDPAEALMEAADKIRADLIVVGDRGMGGAHRFTVGGVPDRVSHYTPVDLLLVKTTRPDREEGRYRKVLLATDGSFTADQATGRGYGLASAVGASVSLVYVGDELLGNIVLRDTSERLSEEPIDQHVLKGHPSDRICELAESQGHDLVVVGNKGMVGGKRFLLAAVPNKVSHNAVCDVLISKTVGRELRDLQPGEGGVVEADGQKVAAFVDDDGTAYTVLAKCQHMGCTVGWNSKARTWDCPCHGSRYDHTGAVINGPTKKPLPPVEAEQ
ncbi:MAG: universal stress protein [Acidimicrobiia bacterium]